MRKFVALFAACLMALSCTACQTETASSSEPPTSRTDGDATIPDPVDPAGQTEAAFLDSNAMTEGGLYYLTMRDKTATQNGPYYYLVQYMDDATGETMTLCNKPNCEHNDESCPAYIDVEANLNIGTAFLFVYNGKLYMFNQDGHLYASELDGTGRTAVITLPGKYTYGSGYLLDGCVFLDADYMDDSEEEESLRYRAALLRLNLADNTYEELYAYSTVSDTLLGVLPDRAVYARVAELPAAENPLTQEERDALYNGLETKILTRTFADGTEEILLDTTSGEADPIRMIGDTLYFHSRQDRTLYQCDPMIGEQTPLQENLEGYITFPEYALYDGRLLYIKNNTETYAYEPTPSKNECFALKTDTQDVQEITLQPIEEEDYFTGFTAETPGYYILWVGIKEVEYTPPGGSTSMVPAPVCWRIPKDAFWRGDYTHEEVEWDGTL